MMVRLMRVLAVLALVSTMVLAPFTPVQAQAAATVPITGVFDGGTFDGTFTIQRFIPAGQQVTALGRLEGTLFNEAGEVIGTVSRNIQLPVTI
jgi:hypothetical protein